MNKNDLKAKLLAGAKSDATWMKEAEERIINEKWLDLSFAIAVRILSSLKEKKMTQVQLAEKVGVSAQMINKIVKGKELGWNTMLIVLTSMVEPWHMFIWKTELL
jgi:predicted XRE-type DNA-binding protein